MTKIKLGNMLKRLFSILLCVCLIFFTCYKVPVSAAGGITDLGSFGAEIVESALAALGVGISAKEDVGNYKQHCQNIWDTWKTNTLVGGALLPQFFSYAGNVLSCSPSAIASIAKLACKEFPQLSVTYSSCDAFLQAMGLDSYGTWDFSSGRYFGNGLPVNSGSVNYTNVIKIDSFTGINVSSLLTAGKTTNFISTNNRFKLSFINGPDDHGDFDETIQLESGNNLFFADTVEKHCDDRAAHWLYDLQYAVQGGPWIVYISDDSAMRKDLWFSVPVNEDGLRGWATHAETIDAVEYKDLYDGASDSMSYCPCDNNQYAQGYSVLTNGIGDVIGVLGKLVGEDGKIGLHIGDVVGSIANVASLVSSLTQSNVLEKDITQALDNAKDETYNQTKNKDTTQNKSLTIPNLYMPTSFQKKFPFCLPWDVYNCVCLFKSDPVCPAFTIPFLKGNFYGMSFNQSITLDVSKVDSKGIIGNICRWFSRIAIIVGLIFITKKLIWK